jgi:uncharacterized protein DUF2442
MEKQTISRRRSKARVVTTNSEIDRAIARAKERGDAPLVTEAEYKSATNLDLLILKLSDGHRCVIPREDLQGLQSATKEQIADIEILGGGTGLHWPALDVDLYVPSLLQGIYGNRRWMAKIGQRGGLATTAAKKRASRANGRRGGRPRSKEQAESA